MEFSRRFGRQPRLEPGLRTDLDRYDATWTILSTSSENEKMLYLLMDNVLSVLVDGFLDESVSIAVSSEKDDDDHVVEVPRQE